MLGIDVHDPRPAREQIASRIRDRITSGDLHVGDRLPTTRELAEQYQTSIQTITEAVRILRAEHLVVSRTGSGVFVADPNRVPPAAAAPTADVTSALRHLHEQVQDIAAQLKEVRDLLDAALGEGKQAALSRKSPGKAASRRPDR